MENKIIELNLQHCWWFASPLNFETYFVLSVEKKIAECEYKMLNVCGFVLNVSRLILVTAKVRA